MNDEKYIVFKRKEFITKMNALRLEVDQSIVSHIQSGAIDDAVVIRRQDVFAPPALDAYANSITIVIEVLKKSNPDITTEGLIKGLRDAADYFHEQARESWQTVRKLPD